MTARSTGEAITKGSQLHGAAAACRPGSNPIVAVRRGSRVRLGRSVTAHQRTGQLGSSSGVAGGGAVPGSAPTVVSTIIGGPAGRRPTGSPPRLIWAAFLLALIPLVSVAVDAGQPTGWAKFQPVFLGCTR